MHLVAESIDLYHLIQETYEISIVHIIRSLGEFRGNRYQIFYLVDSVVSTEASETRVQNSNFISKNCQDFPNSLASNCSSIFDVYCYSFSPADFTASNGRWPDYGGAGKGRKAVDGARGWRMRPI